MADPTKTEEVKLVRIYNRSRRAFIHGKFNVGPGFHEIPTDVAALLLKSYPMEIIEAAVAHKELGGLGAVVSEQKAEIEKLKAELEALKAPKTGKASDAV
jgi:hypothetical protein